MDTERVSPTLRVRLGDDGTTGLLALLDAAGREWKAEVTADAVVRFDGRLSVELGALRGEMAQMRDELRGEMAHIRDDLRGEMAQMRTDLRGEMAQMHDALRDQMWQMRDQLRAETRDGDASLREELRDRTYQLRDEIRDVRVELIAAMDKLQVGLTRTTFGMWMGQLVAMAAIMAAMFQAFAR
jgi:hypothetical protein